MPSNVVERALWMEADRMGFLLDAFTQAKLDNQRDVVRNERRQNYEIRPYGPARAAIAEAVWPTGHPYHHLTIGTHEDLEAASVEDVSAFFRTWYVPNNATLCVAGDIDLARTLAWIERYFGPIPRGADPSPVRRAEAPLPTAKTTTISDDVQLPRVHLVWRSPSFFAEGDAELDVLTSILTDGKASRLHKRLVFQDRIAKDVEADQYSASLGSTYQIEATVAPGHKTEEVLAALDEELTKVRADGPTDAEVARALNNWRKAFYQRLESVASKAGQLQSYNHFTGDPGYLKKDLARYESVTSASVRRWAAETLRPEHLVTVIVVPASEEVAARGAAAAAAQ